MLRIWKRNPSVAPEIRHLDKCVALPYLFLFFNPQDEIYPWVMFLSIPVGYLPIGNFEYDVGMNRDDKKMMYEMRRRRLAEYIEGLGVGGQKRVADAIDKDASYVSRMLYPDDKSGRKRIGDEMVLALESGLSLPRGWFDGLSSDAEPISSANVSYVGKKQKKGEYPLISWVSAGSWLEAVEPYRKDEIEVWPETTVDASDSSFWLRVRGDSMTSPNGFTVPEGMIILVDPEKEAVSGKLVVAKLENENEATFKQYMTDAGRKYLKALNPHHPPTIINGNCKIIGVVVDIKWEHIP